MPTYSTTAPIDLAVNVQVGRIEVVAGDRADTVVTVSASNPAQEVDRRGAEETAVEFDGRRVTIKGPRPRLSWIGPTESVDVHVELPAESRFTAEIAVGGVHTVGHLGATRIKSSTGSVDLDITGDLWLRASSGSVTVGSVEGEIDMTADHGQIRIGSVAGEARLGASYGNILLGESGGDLDAKLSYGDLEITKALASIAAKTAYGSIRLREVSSGSIEAESGFGEVDIGVRQGVAAWLDLSSKNGHVRNGLAADGGPDSSEQTVEVRARTQFGDISVRRSR